MRFSLTLAACIGGAALLTITACQATPETAPVIKGTVVEKEYEAEKTVKKKGSYPTKSCRTISRNGKPDLVCKTITTKHTRLVTTQMECYELDIKTESGNVVETCDKAAYMALDVDDFYDSSRNYSREDQ